MPVIQTYDPFTAASDALGGYLAQKRQNTLNDQAQAYQRSRDTRQDLEADRSFNLQQQQFGLQKQQAESELQTQDQQRRIAAANEEFEKQRRPLLLQQAQVQNKIDQGQLVTQQDAHKLAGAQLADQQLKNQIAQKYGLQSAALDVQFKRADIARTQAETGLLGAQTYREMHPIAKESASVAAQTSLDNAINALSPQGQQFLEMLYSTNNPPNRVQAELALRSSALSPLDKKNLFTIIESKQTQFLTPTGQGSASRAIQRRGEINAETNFRDVAKGKSYNALPPALREMIRSAMVDHGMSPQDAVQAADDSNLPLAAKTAIKKALLGG